MSEETEQFEITDDTLANWAFQKLAEDDAKLKELEAKRDQYNKQTKEWFERNANKIVDQQAYMQQKLNEYRLTKDNGKIDVPAGQTIARHTNKAIYDDAKLVEYVKANNPDMLKYSVDKAKFKKTIDNVNGKAVDENGQIVDGMTFEATESVSFKLNK